MEISQSRGILALLEAYLRPWYQRVLIDKLAKSLSGIFTANQITLLAVIFGCLSAVCIYFNYELLAIILLILSGVFDSLDGTVARLKNTSTTMGCVLDIIADRVVEVVIIYALFLVAPVIRSDAAMAMLGSVVLCITAFLVIGVFAEKSGYKSFFYSPGLMERAEAFVFFIAMIIWPAAFNTLAWVFCALVLITAALHVYRFRQHLD